MEELVNDLRNFLTPKGVILAGGGEPTFWEGNLAYYVRRLSEFCSVGIDTNGTLLDRFLRDDTIWRFFYITVPIIGYNRESYLAVCGHNQFDVVDRNLREILRIKKSRGFTYPYINLKIAINQRNYKGFVSMVRYAESIGADNIFIRCMNNFEGRTDVELTSEQKEFIYEAVMKDGGFNRSYVGVFAENLIRSENPPSAEGEKLTTEPSHCWTVILMHNMGIKQNGDVFLCVPTTDQEEFSIGNINLTRLTEIWGSEQHLEVIQKLDQRMRNGLCDLRKCRHYRLNIVLEMARNGTISPFLPTNEFLKRHAPFL